MGTLRQSDNQTKADTPQATGSAGARPAPVGQADAALPTPQAVHTRRDLVGHGVKLAFVAPVISTLLAKDAYAGTAYCSPLGAPCTQDSDCCSGICDVLGSNTCY
jgi:hypothetical protein